MPLPTNMPDAKVPGQEPSITLRKVDWGLDTPEQKAETAAFKLVAGKIDETIKTMSERSGADADWIDFFAKQNPFLKALFQLAQEPDIQHNVQNLKTLTDNFRAEQPVSGWQPLVDKESVSNTDSGTVKVVKQGRAD